MIFKVDPHKITKEKIDLVNEQEINVSECEFVFEDIPTNYTKEAYFTLNGGDSYKVILVNNKCDIPNEVLQEKGMIEIGIVVYEIIDEEYVKRFNPAPVYITTLDGSLKNAKNTEPITPTDKEQYEQAIQEGLNDISEAIVEAGRLDIDVAKADHTATITITKQDGTTKEVEINDGEKGEKGDKGDKGDAGKDGINGQDGRDGIDGKDGKDGVNGKDGTNGTNGQDGYTPQRGVDYWTNQDIATIEQYIDSKTTGLLTSNY